MVTLLSRSEVLLGVLKRVLRRPRYLIVFLGLSFLSLSAVVLLPNQALLWQTIQDGGVTFATKVSLVIALYGSIATSFTILGAIYTLVLLFLFSLNVTLLLFYIRRAQKKAPGRRVQLGGLIGSLSGLLGIGCATCGSVILAGAAASLGASSLLILLPLHGGEFALFGCVLLGVSIWYLAKKIHDPLVCPVKH